MLGTLLVATICVHGPTDFKCTGPERDIAAQVDMSIEQCQRQAQSLLPQILEMFPNNTVTRYKCVADNGKKKIDI
jgi:hypothetical protein